MAGAAYFHDESALLDRLSKGVQRRNQETIFLVGAPMSAPLTPGAPGVPGVDGIIDLIREEFRQDHDELSAFEEALSQAGDSCYQAAFVFLQGRRGQQTANEIIARAVHAARLPIHESAVSLNELLNDEELCRRLDLDATGWALSPGTEGLGKLAANYPTLFGRFILTTNFDPLVEVGVRRAGGHYFRTSLQADGDLTQTDGTGCHVVHLHGYWHGSDTLHTARQLGQSRPKLRSSLRFLLRNRLMVVCAYGGWDDAFTEALMEIVRDDPELPEVIWTFFDRTPALPPKLAEKLAPGIDRGRVNLYSGIDCHRFLPMLYERWSRSQTSEPIPSISQSNPVHVPEALIKEIGRQTNQQPIVEGDDEDRPPVVNICVGRDQDLKKIRESEANVVFITGLGGQGKSTVAAQYFEESQGQSEFTYYVWRDCKEEGERFENQLASVIEKLSQGRVTGKELTKQDASSIVQILMSLIQDADVLFVFDNVDHYVNLQTGRMAGSINVFVDALLRTHTRSRAVFTCRPPMQDDRQRALHCPLHGLDLAASVQLFTERGALADTDEIARAHRLTKGHAFWLDLLAVQVVRRVPPVELSQLLGEIEDGSGVLPESTLSSIWESLREREQLVLRAMAETVKPETESQIYEYLSDRINYNKLGRSLRSLRDLNLVVLKKRRGAADLHELHPLVRHFVRQTFSPTDRSIFIDPIIRVYKRLIGKHKSQLNQHPPLSVLQYWTQNAELDVETGNYSDAFETLAEAAEAFGYSGYVREFSRVARLLLRKVDWVRDHHNFAAFERVFSVHTKNLSFLGERYELDELLDQYALTASEKNSRYIHYCDMRCHAFWVRGEFAEAVMWGKEGKSLKASGVDTQYDPSHNLALAERDAGRPELALPFFLAGQTLATATDTKELDVNRGGAHYGNVGRCLHFMGQIESALICYQKSALLLERTPGSEYLLNQGYIRLWISELLLAREEARLAYIFARAALLKWERVYPLRTQEIRRLARQAKSKLPGEIFPNDSEVEKICLDWILGYSTDNIVAKAFREASS